MRQPCLHILLRRTLICVPRCPRVTRNSQTHSASSIQRGTSQYRLVPIAAAGQPTINAAAQGVAKTVATQVVASTPTSSGVTSVGLAMPQQFAVTNSPVTSSGTLTAAWVAQPPGFVLETPPPGLSGFEGTNATSVTVPVTPSVGSLTLSLVPQTSSSFGLYCSAANNGGSTPTGWTALNAGGGNDVFYKAITGTSPVTVTQTYPGGSGLTGAIGALALFSGPAPSLIQSKIVNGTIGGTLSFTSNNTAGHTLIVVMQYIGTTSFPSASLSMSDSNGNTYQQILNQFNLFGTPINENFQQGVFVAANCAGGANTVTYSLSPAVLANGWVLIMEFGPLAAGSSIPFFGPLAGAQIPPINLAAAGNGGVGNVLKVVNGGTGVTTSTGTGNTVLSANPTFTGTVALPGVTMTGKTIIYNGIGTVTNGQPAEYATVDLTARAAAITATTLYAVPAAGVGMYRVSMGRQLPLRGPRPFWAARTDSRSHIPTRTTLSSSRPPHGGEGETTVLRQRPPLGTRQARASMGALSSTPKPPRISSTQWTTRAAEPPCSTTCISSSKPYKRKSSPRHGIQRGLPSGGRAVLFGRLFIFVHFFVHFLYQSFHENCCKEGACSGHSCSCPQRE